MRLQFVERSIDKKGMPVASCVHSHDDVNVGGTAETSHSRSAVAFGAES